MTTTHVIEVIDAPALEDKRCAFVMAEDRVGHYPEFRDFLERSFDLARVGLSSPGYVCVESARIYQLIFIGRSGEPFPSGIEINAVVDSLEPLNDERVDLDLWEILRWVIDGVGAPWSVEDLEQTGKLYRIPAARG